MTPCLTLREGRADLDAQCLVCLYLVRACRQAMYSLALADRSDPEAHHRAIEVLKIVHRDWVEGQRAIARALNCAKRAGPAGQPTRPDRRHRHASSLV